MNSEWKIKKKQGLWERRMNEQYYKKTAMKKRKVYKKAMNEWNYISKQWMNEYLINEGM